MQIQAEHSPVLSMNVPEWFEHPDFMAWLNRDKNSLMTWHTKGEAPNEWSDIIVFVDPSLGGEGSEDGTMPDKYWDLIVSACRSNFKPGTGLHVIVRLTNLEE